MNIEEQHLITRVFEEIGSGPAINKDADADRLIRACVDRVPDASYRLVQSVIVQQREMHRLEERVRDLEWAARLLPSAHDGVSFLAPPPGGSATSGSANGSVPPVAERYGQDLRDDRPRETLTVPPSGPGFLASALTTATGFAGGMLLTDGLRKLLGGESTGAPMSGSAFGWDRTRDELQDARTDAADARRQLADDDAALDDAQDAQDTQNDNAWDYGEA